MHLEKYKKSDIRRVLAEELRTDEYMLSHADDPNIKRIDKGQICHDMIIDGHGDMLPVKRPAGQFPAPGRCSSVESIYHAIDTRLGQLKGGQRKNGVAVGSICVTMPQELIGKVKPEQFFMMVFDGFGKRYGKENVISGIVHMDETTPHMHLMVVPEIDGRCCAKELWNKKELSQMHRDMDKAVEIVFGMSGLMLNGRTKGNYTTAELKERSRREKELEEREQQLAKWENQLRDKEKELRDRELYLQDMLGVAEQMKEYKENLVPIECEDQSIAQKVTKMRSHAGMPTAISRDDDRREWQHAQADLLNLSFSDDGFYHQGKQV